MTVDPGANRFLTLPIDLEVLPDDVVVSQLEVPVATVAEALRSARRAGARSIFDPSPMGEGSSSARDADIVVVNQTEAAELAGTDAVASVEAAVEAAHRMLAEGSAPARTIIVTLGAGGVVAVGPTGVTTTAAVEVDPVDTVGAGDCFLGVLAAGLAAGDDLAGSMARANHAAAISTTRRGAVDAMPFRSDLG